MPRQSKGPYLEFKRYKHHLPGAFAPIMDASKTFGRFDQNPMFSRESPYRFRTSNG
jgi:hypothetical protein